MDFDLSDITAENVYDLNNSHVETILRAVFTPTVWLTMSNFEKLQSKYFFYKFIESPGDRQRFTFSQYIKRQLELLNQLEEENQSVVGEVGSEIDLMFSEGPSSTPIMSENEHSDNSSGPYFEYFDEDVTSGDNWFVRDCSTVNLDAIPSTSGVSTTTKKSDGKSKEEVPSRMYYEEDDTDDD